MKGSDKTFGKWFGANWMWLTIVGVMLFGVTGLGYKIFSTYAATFPYISNDHTAWASFGSLLAGFFTLTGTVATVATLLFLARQNKAMQKVTQAQLDTLTFERYINHRKLFIEQLKDLEIAHNNSFRFINPNKLYKDLFRENGPHNCDFSSVPEFDDKGYGLNNVGKIIFGFDGLEDRCNIPHFDRAEVDEFVRHLVYYHNEVLMIERVRDGREGDLKFGSTPYLINIFSLSEFFTVAVDVSNMILQFSGNSLLSSFKSKHESRWVRDALMEYYYVSEGYLPISITSEIAGVKDLVSIYFEVFQLRNSENGLLFPKTNSRLIQAFSSSSNVNNHFQ